MYLNGEAEWVCPWPDSTLLLDLIWSWTLFMKVSVLWNMRLYKNSVSTHVRTEHIGKWEMKLEIQAVGILAEYHYLTKPCFPQHPSWVRQADWGLTLYPQIRSSCDYGGEEGSRETDEGTVRSQWKIGEGERRERKRERCLVFNLWRWDWQFLIVLLSSFV